MAIAGERIWAMPRWRQRLVPNLDIEGEGLARRLDGERSPSELAPSVL
jgi:RND superfamily putative drug exporter